MAGKVVKLRPHDASSSARLTHYLRSLVVCASQDQLYDCFKYCEDDVRCRRSLQLEHFGETFDKSLCNKTCDNCRGGKTSSKEDFTFEAKEILGLLRQVKQVTDGVSCTLVQLGDLYRGLVSSSKKVVFQPQRDLPSLGLGKRFKKAQVEGILYGMLAQHILEEKSERGGMGFLVTKVHHGNDAPLVEHNTKKFEIEVTKPAKGRPPPKEMATKKKAGKKKTRVDKDDVSDQEGPDHEVIELDDESEDEFMRPIEVDTGADRLTKKKLRNESASGLAKKQVLELEKYIRNKTKLWAFEESESSGRTVRYWNVISNQQAKDLAQAAPLNKAEFMNCSTLGDAKNSKYGKKIVAAVKEWYIENELWDGVPNSRKTQEAWSPGVPSNKKKAPVSAGRSSSGSGSKRKLSVDRHGGESQSKLRFSQEVDEDPFDAGIDYGAITNPTDSLQLTQTFRSSHFSGGGAISPVILSPKPRNTYSKNGLEKYKNNTKKSNNKGPKNPYAK